MGRLQFEEFELRIGRGHGDSYATWVVRSPAGEANGTFTLPFGPARLKEIKTLVELAMLRSRQLTRTALSTELRELKIFGSELFDALFTGDIRTAYVNSRALALRQGKGLRIKLRIEPGELIDLPWEFLYDRENRRFVALSNNTPLVRHVELQTPVPPLQLKPPLHLLVVVASPSDYPALNVKHEKERIQQALERLIQRGLIEVDYLPHATVPALQDRLREKPVHMLHFIGHGGYLEEHGTGVLIFEDDQGKGRRIYGEQLRHLIGDVLTLRLVVLNACNGARGWDRDSDPLKAYPGIAEALVHAGIAGVVANQFEITDEAAIIFARELYSALADSFPLDAAVAEARKAIDLSRKNTVEWASPVLYSRAPDGLIFDIPADGNAGDDQQTHDSQREQTQTPHPASEKTPVSAPDELIKARMAKITPSKAWAALLTTLGMLILAGLAVTAISDFPWFLNAKAANPNEPALPTRPASVVAPGHALPAMPTATVTLAPTPTPTSVATEIPSAVAEVPADQTLAAGESANSFITPTRPATEEPPATISGRVVPGPGDRTPTTTVTSLPPTTPSFTSTAVPSSATVSPTVTSTPRVGPARAQVIAGTGNYPAYNIRSGPSSHCSVIGGISTGTLVTAHGGWLPTDSPTYPTGWNWILIETDTGIRGWVWGVGIEVIEPGVTLPRIPQFKIPDCPQETYPATATPRATVRPKNENGTGATKPTWPTATPTPTPIPTRAPRPTPTPWIRDGIPRPPTPTPVSPGF